MVTAHPDRNSNMLFANFNQDFSCISVGTRKGYGITNCYPFERAFTSNDGARGIVEMLFCTSLIALVGAADQPHSSPRKLQIVNTKRQSLICELLFPSSILAVKLNRKNLVIVLEVEIYIYDISNMKLLHVIETPPNPEAICALSPHSDSSYLAYPSLVPSPSSITRNPAAPTPSSSPPQSQSGDVILFSTHTLTVANVIRAHKAPISFLALNSTGTLLATASDKGTVIRVWSVPRAEKLYQFRRGTGEARIYSINFNAASTLMAVSSAHDTVHIFKLGNQEKGSRNGTVKLGNQEKGSRNSTVKLGNQEKGSKNSTVKLGDPEKGSKNSTVKLGDPEKGSKNSTMKLGDPEKGSKNNTVKLGDPEKGSKNSLVGDKPESPAGNLDSREKPSGIGGGYETFIDEKKKNGVSPRGRSLHLIRNATSSMGGRSLHLIHNATCSMGGSLHGRSLQLTRTLTSSMGGYLPHTITELWEPSRDFAFLKLPTSGARCVVALSGAMPQVMVISSEGFFYSYTIDLENGGECALMKQYSLLDSGDEGGIGTVN